MNLYHVFMNSISITSSSAHEYVFKFKEKISPEKKRNIIAIIKSHALYHRSYNKDGSIWYEMRSPDNRKYVGVPDASFLISKDFLYVMRKSKSPTLWHSFDALRDCIQDDLDFICEGSFYSSAR